MEDNCLVTRAVKNIFLSGNLANGEKIFCKVNYVMQNTFASAGHNLLKRPFVTKVKGASNKGYWLKN